MKIFFIRDKQYVSTSSQGNLGKIVSQINDDWGAGNVFFKASHKNKIGTIVFNHVDISFARSLPFQYHKLLDLYMPKSDAMRLVPFTDADFVPDNQGKYKHFKEVIEIVGIAEPFVLIQDVINIYRNIIIMAIRNHGFSNNNYEFPTKIEVQVYSNTMKVSINYKV